MKDIVVGTALALATVLTIYLKHRDYGAGVLTVVFSLLLVAEAIALLLR
jgi:hypothetical protein